VEEPGELTCYVEKEKESKSRDLKMLFGGTD
jgi:hypothetical protein